MLLFLCGLCERGLEHSHQVCQMPNIWHLTHQTPKYEPNKVFQIPKILAHCYSTVSNMRRYGHKCQTKQLIFYSTFSLSSHWFVFLQPMFSISFFFRSDSITLLHPQINGTAALWMWIKPPSPIKPLPSLHVWRLYHRWSEDTIVAGLKQPLPPRSEAAMPPWSEPILAMAWSCSTACLIRISAMAWSCNTASGIYLVFFFFFELCVGCWRMQWLLVDGC